MAKRAKGGNAATLERPQTSKSSQKSSKRGQKGNAELNALPASVSTGNADRQRELSRRETSDNRFRPNLKPEDRQKEVQQSSRVEQQSQKAKAAGEKNRSKTVDELRDQTETANPTPTAQIDHGIKNHGREEHNHTPGAAGAHVEGPAPRRVTDVKDEAVILETLRFETKADNLYLMRREERESPEPRQHVIDAINQRLLEVQGAPILDE